MGNEATAIPDDWCSAHQHAYLAQLNGRRIVGENPGGLADASTAGMADVFDQMREWRYLGIMWVRQSQMTTPGYATVSDLAAQISADEALPA